MTPNQYGVPQTVPEGESIKYLAKEAATDPKIVGLVANMYPHRALSELGLDNRYQAFYAGKIALWCHIIPGWNINNVTVNPSPDRLGAGNRRKNPGSHAENLPGRHELGPGPGAADHHHA